jgi:hypothetical protein
MRKLITETNFNMIQWLNINIHFDWYRVKDITESAKMLVLVS